MDQQVKDNRKSLWPLGTIKLIFCGQIPTGVTDCQIFIILNTHSRISMTLI